MGDLQTSTYARGAMFHRIVSTTALTCVVVLATAGTAIAHIEPDPADAQAGSTLSVGFTVEHGCDGSPTIGFDMRLPEGVTDADPDPIEGWEGSIADDVVTFVGGPLAADTSGEFSVTMTLPATPDTTIYFPFVQRCEQGEIRWIGIPNEADDELDEPAPALALTGPAVVATTVAPVGSVAPNTAPSVVDPTTPVATEATASAPTTEVAVSTNPNKDGSSDTGTIVFIVTMLAVGVVGLLAYLRARSARNAS